MSKIKPTGPIRPFFIKVAHTRSEWEDGKWVEKEGEGYVLSEDIGFVGDTGPGSDKKDRTIIYEKHNSNCKGWTVNTPLSKVKAAFEARGYEFVDCETDAETDRPAPQRVVPTIPL
jgi:hypothetical protein